MNKPAILFITSYANWPLTDGKRQRTWFLLKALAVKYTVDILYIGFPQELAAVERERCGVRAIYSIDLTDSKFLQPGYPSFLMSKIQQTEKAAFLQATRELFDQLYRENSYSFVFSRYISPIFALPLERQFTIVCDIDDVYYEAQQTKIRKEKRFLQRLKLQLFYYIGTTQVEKVMQRIQLSLVVKKSDTRYPGLAGALCVPNLPFGHYIENTPQFVITPQVPDTILTIGFIGKLSYGPNENGLLDFITSVWQPLMEKGVPIRMLIAGSGDISERLQQAIASTKGIKLLGFVTSSEKFWNAISVLVVPVGEGAGSNIKIAEALLYGKTIVAHPFASRGYELFLNHPIFILPLNNEHWKKELHNLATQPPLPDAIVAQKAKTVFDLENWKTSLLQTLSQFD